MVARKNKLSSKSLNTPAVTVVDDGFVATTVKTLAESIDKMVAEQALEINNKVIAWIGGRDGNVEVYRSPDTDTYLLTKDGKTIDKLVLEYNTAKVVV